MTRKSKRTLLSLILSMMLIVAMAFHMTACSDNDTEQPNSGTEVDVGKADSAQDDENVQGNVEVQGNNLTQTNATVLGEGDTIFLFTVVDADGKEKLYEIHTDKIVVGDALLELELIDGENQEYGLYVKTVDGITVDYDTDEKYWAFYVNGEYAMTGVDATPITAGEEYSFKVE